MSNQHADHCSSACGHASSGGLAHTHAGADRSHASSAHTHAPHAAGLACCAHGDEHNQGGARWLPLALAVLLALIAEVLHWRDAPWWMQALPAGVAVALSGVHTYKNGWMAILRADLNINALMSIAVTGAFALGQWPEAAMVMVLFSIAESIEEHSVARARHTIEGLLSLTPQTVQVQQQNGSWHSVPAKNVAVGTMLRAAPGERIGLDGIVHSGESTVDQAPITGESMPMEKRRGDLVYAGTINGMGELQYLSSAAYEHTLLSRIIESVTKAQANKAPAQRFMDRFAKVYTPLVCMMAALVAVVPPLLFDGGWHDWVYRALVLLVVACPCALVISTPVAIVSALTAAARHGLLIKGGAYLEQGRKLAWLALDKTGTLTSGRPSLTDVVDLSSPQSGSSLQLAASLARRSDHPVAEAIGRGWSSEILDVDGFRATAGGGIEGFIDGRNYRLGSRAWLAANANVTLSSDVSLRLQALHDEGNTVSLLTCEGRVLALFAVRDVVRDSSALVIAQLHELGVRTAMLSGDNPATARVIARQLGIDTVHAGLLPEEKLAVVRQYCAEGVTGMVGDGINDGPALAQADIGFAMAAMGSDTARETADVALMDDDLHKLPRFIRLSRSTHTVLVQNVVLALGIKLGFLGLAIAGLGTMWMAVFADVGASLLVVANSLRLLQR